MKIEIVEVFLGGEVRLRDKFGVFTFFAGQTLVVSHAVEEIVASVDMSKRLLKIEVSGAAGLSSQVVGSWVVVSEHDIVHQGESAVRTAWIPAVKIEGVGGVGDDSVIRDESPSSLPEVEGDRIAGTAEIAKMGVVCGRLAGDRRGHSHAVGDGDVVDKDGGIFIGPPFEGGAAVAVGDGVLDGHRTVRALVGVAEIEPVLGVIAEVRVVDVDGQAHAGRRSDSVAVSTVALAVACDRARVRILLVASAPFNGGILEVPDAVDAGG